MSIHLEGPSLLLNSYDFTDQFGGCGMTMDKTWNCPKTTTAKHVANWIGMAAKEAGGKSPAMLSSTFMASRGVSSSARLRRE